MSGQEYAPGTVAVATVRDVAAVRVMWDGSDWVGAKVAGCWEHPDARVADVRPLVVLDPADSDLPGVVEVLAETGRFSGTVKAIRDQTKPPKPAEPQGLGAVVEDADAYVYVRGYQPLDTVTHPWHVIDPSANKPMGWWKYADIDAVKVPSEGVTR